MTISRFTRTAGAGALVFAMAACGATTSAGDGATAMPTMVGSADSPTSAVSSPTGASAPAAIPHGTEVVVTCPENSTDIAFYAASDGQLLRTSPGSGDQFRGSFPTDSGEQMRFAPGYDDAGIGAPTTRCNPTVYNADYTRLAGIATTDDGQTFPATVDISDSPTIHLLAGPTTETAFAAPDPPKVYRCLYDAAGTLWWLVGVESGDEEKLYVRSDGGDDVELDTSNYIVEPQQEPSLFVGRNGRWGAGVPTTGGGDVQGPATKLRNDTDGQLQMTRMQSGAFDGLPHTRYALSLGRYEVDGARAAFFGTAPTADQDDASLFVARTGRDGGLVSETPTAVAEHLPVQPIITFSRYAG